MIKFFKLLLYLLYTGICKNYPLLNPLKTIVLEWMIPKFWTSSNHVNLSKQILKILMDVGNFENFVEI